MFCIRLLRMTLEIESNFLCLKSDKYFAFGYWAFVQSGHGEKEEKLIGHFSELRKTLTYSDL